MLLAGVGCLIVGYTLLYAGVRGVDWSQPWQLWLPGGGQPAPGANNPPGAPPNPGYNPGGPRAPDLTPLSPPGGVWA